MILEVRKIRYDAFFMHLIRKLVIRLMHFSEPSKNIYFNLHGFRFVKFEIAASTEIYLEIKFNK